MKNKLPLRIANTLFFLLMVGVNVLANIIPLGDFNTGQISAMYPTLITPAGWTFAIWGVIYTLLAIVIARQLIDSRYADDLTIGPYFIISCVLNALWIYAWHTQQMLLAAVVILILLITLWKLYVLTREKDFLTKAAFSIYYAWITAATIVMLFAAGKALTGHAPITPIVPRGAASAVTAEPTGLAAFLEQFTGILLMSGTPVIVSYVTVGEYIMAVIALILLTAIVLINAKKYQDSLYLATAEWALAGILIRQITSPTPPTILIIACAAAMAVIAYFMIDTLTKTKKGEPNEND